MFFFSFRRENHFSSAVHLPFPFFANFLVFSFSFLVAVARLYKLFLGSLVRRLILLAVLFCFVFLVACYATLHPALSVGRSHFTVYYVFYSLTVLLLPNCSGELKYSPCPPAHDWGSCVSGLVSKERDCPQLKKGCTGSKVVSRDQNNFFGLKLGLSICLYIYLSTLCSKASDTSKSFIVPEVFILRNSDWFHLKAYNLPFIHAKFHSTGSSSSASIEF